jgi:hypothetical protein
MQPRQINLYGIFVSDCLSIYTFPSSKGGCGFIQISWCPAYPSIRHHLYPKDCFRKRSKITQPRQINLYGGFMSDCPSIYTFHSSKGGCCFIQISWRPSYPSIRHHLYTQEHYYFRISAKNHATSTNKSDCPFIRSILQ